MGEVVPFPTRAARSRPDVVRREPGVRDARRTPPPARAPVREPLWREVTGAVLRQERRSQRRTLAQVAARAGMSVQYLSELERGRKEASSEMLAAACGSLGLNLLDFATRCAGMLGSGSRRPGGPTLLAA